MYIKNILALFQFPCTAYKTPPPPTNLPNCVMHFSSFTFFSPSLFKISSVSLPVSVDKIYLNVNNNNV